MNTIIMILQSLMELINVLYDYIDGFISKRIEAHKWWLTKRDRRMTIGEFNQYKRNCLMVIIKILGLAYPLTGIVYFNIYRKRSDDFQEKVFYINRVLIIILTFWAILKWDFLWGQQMDSTLMNVVINYLIAFNPIRAALSVLYYNLNYINKDFLEQDPSEWAIDEEKEKETLDEYDEYGDK